MNDKKDLYTIVWQQTYNDFADQADQLFELMVEASDMTDANEVINRIKAL